MAQHDYVIANGTGAAVRSDLNNALAAIVSNNSGATEPATMYAYQWWADTTTGLLKLRNAANNAWITLRELDGTLTIEDGTASSPGLAFADDLNTGIYSPSADQLGITTGGTVRLTTTTTGITSVLPVDVPLGTASAPTVTFTGDLNTGIYSPGADQVAISTNGTQRVTVDTAATTSTLPVVHPLGAVGTPSITFTGDLNTGIWSPAADTIAFSEGGVEAMRIDSSGRVGIGTTAPSTPLHIGGATDKSVRVDSSNGNAAFYGIFQNEAQLTVNRDGATGTFTDTGKSAATLTLEGANGGSTIRFATASANNTGPSERARIDSSGRLLVGTSSAFDSSTTVQIKGAGSFAAGTLDIQSNYNQSIADQGVGLIRFLSDNGAWRASMACLSDAASGSATDAPGRLVFSVTRDGQASPTEALRINEKGALKATTTGTYNSAITKTHELRNDVNDWGTYIHNVNAAPKGLLLSFPGASPNGTGNEFLYCDDSSAIRATIRSNGGISNYQANNVNLSDRNAKKDIIPAAGTWDCIKEWEIVNYRYKDQPDDADLNLGVIAQQVAESCPEVITVFEEAKEARPAVLDEDGNEIEPAQEARPEKLGIKEQQMYWMAIKALQEAQVRIETLEAKVADLEAA